MKATNSILNVREPARILGLMAIIFFGVATIGSKGSGENVQVVSCTDGKFKLIYLKDSDKDIRIEVLNQEGDILESDLVRSKKRFIKTYDLAVFGSGDYVFRIEDGDGANEYPVFFEKEIGMALYKMGKTSKYKLVVQNPRSIVLVGVYDEHGSILKSDRINSEVAFTRVYDFSSDIESANGLSFEVVDDRGLLKKATF